MSAEYSLGEVRARFEAWYPGSGIEDGDTSAKVAARFGYQAAYADLRERIKADEGAVTDEVTERACKAMGRVKGFYPSWPEMRAALLDVWPNPPAQAAQVDDKVVVIRDGKSTTQGLVLAAAIYMGAVKDVFALRSDGPPYNERKVTKDAAALRAFDHLDAATKALRSAISHYTPTAEPVAQAAAWMNADGGVCTAQAKAKYPHLRDYTVPLARLAAQPAERVVEHLRELSDAASKDWEVVGGSIGGGSVVGGPTHDFVRGSSQSQIASFSCPRLLPDDETSNPAKIQQANAKLAVECVAYVRTLLAAAPSPGESA